MTLSIACSPLWTSAPGFDRASRAVSLYKLRRQQYNLRRQQYNLRRQHGHLSCAPPTKRCSTFTEATTCPTPRRAVGAVRRGRRGDRITTPVCCICARQNKAHDGHHGLSPRRPDSGEHGPRRTPTGATALRPVRRYDAAQRYGDRPARLTALPTRRDHDAEFPRASSSSRHHIGRAHRAGRAPIFHRTI